MISATPQPDSNNYVRFADSSVTFSIERDARFPTRFVRTTIGREPIANKKKRFEQTLDSLGYFCRRCDTLSDTSVMCYPGFRAVVGTETVIGIDSVFFEKLPQIQYPRLYNAGEFSTRAQNLTTILAENGYPFATVSLELKKLSLCSESNSDTFAIVFTAHSDELYVNAQPLVYGSKYTSKRLIFNDISIREGARFDLRKQLSSQLRLKSRAYIADVQISPPEIIRTTNVIDSVFRVITQFRVTDKSGIGFDGAAGVSKGADQKMEFNGNMELSLLNVFHTGESGLLGYSGDSRQQRLNMCISKPWIFNLPIEATVEGGLEVVKQHYGFIHGNLKLLTELGMYWRTGVNLQATETTVSSDSIGNSGHFYGVSFIISEKSGAYIPQQFGHQLYIDVGSGISKKNETYSRTQASFEAGVHIPLFWNQAVVIRIHTFHLVTGEDALLPAEMFRLGGNNSLRGYVDDEYAFRTVLNGQFEYLMYFNGLGAVYIFTDGALGYQGRIGFDNNNVRLMGYGLGVNVPTKIGTMTLEWGRNIEDWRNLGRIHIRYRNGLL